MKIRKLATAAVALTLAGSVAVASPAAAGDDQTPARPDRHPRVARCDSPDRNWYDFDILAAGVSAAGVAAERRARRSQGSI